MQRVRAMLRAFVGVVAELMGYALLLVLIANGAVTVWNDRSWSYQFRVLLDRTSEGEELDIQSRPQPRTEAKSNRRHS